MNNIITTIVSFFTRNFNYRTWTHKGSGEVSHFLTLFGFTFAKGWAGNCMWPCLHVDTTIILRFSQRNQITIYPRLRLASGEVRPVSWNWTWIARKFGTCTEQDFGDVYVYNGILGSHCDL